MKARRVLYLDHTAVMGGGEIALVHLVRNLDRSRYTPIAAVLSEGPLIAELTGAGAQTFAIQTGSALVHARKDQLRAGRRGGMGAALVAVLRIARLIEQMGVDLVHCNSLKADFLGGVAARMTHRPVIWHVRDRIESDYLPSTVVAIFRGAANLLPTRVIANSATTLASLRLENPDRGSVIYSGLDLSEMMGIAERPRGEQVRVGIVGRLAQWKGQHIFLQAAARIARRFPHAVFQIVGGPLFAETDYEATLHRLAASLGIAGVTEFTGQRSDVAKLLSEMDVVVHASVTPEPFGQVAVLAMAAGRPLVATAGGGILEIVEHERTGLLVPMNDAAAMAGAIERLLTNADEAARFGRAGRERAAELFTIGKTAQQVMELYDQVTG